VQQNLREKTTHTQVQLHRSGGKRYRPTKIKKANTCTEKAISSASLKKKEKKKRKEKKIKREKKEKKINKKKTNTPKPNYLNLESKSRRREKKR